MYEYKIKQIVSVYDGDTIMAIVDIGFNITIKEKFRLARINAPELTGNTKEQGVISRDALKKYLSSADEVIIKTIKDKKEKYGRYLCELFIYGQNVNDLMVEKGYAAPFVE